MNFEYFNPHPEGLIIGDCAIRAGVVASNYNYYDVEKKLKGNKIYLIIDGYKELGGITIEFPRVPVNVVCNLCEKYSQYNYILIFDTHCAGIRENTIYDLFDCRIKNKNVNYLTIFKATNDEIEMLKRELKLLIEDYIIDKMMKENMLKENRL